LDNSPAAQRIGLETHPGGCIHFSGPLVFLLGFAYDVPFNSKRMTGVPDWGYKEAYVIDAAPDPGVIPAGPTTTALRERVRRTLQALLADRDRAKFLRTTLNASRRYHVSTDAQGSACVPSVPAHSGNVLIALTKCRM